MDQYRLAPQAPYPGNVVVVVPPNNAGAEQKKTQRDYEVLGTMQVVIALIHLGLGGILLYSSKECDTLVMTAWYPFWGGALFLISGCLTPAGARKSVAALEAFSYLFNTLSSLGALAGTCLLLIDVIKNIVKNSNADKKTPPFISKFMPQLIPSLTDYCKITEAYEMGILCVMLFFSLFELVSAGSVIDKKDKKQRRSDNEEQNVALTSVQLTSPPQPHSADGVPGPPQYTAAEVNRAYHAAGNEPHTG